MTDQDFIPLPELHRSWYLSRVWSEISVGQVESFEPMWRAYAGVPAGRGWAFNYAHDGNPGWDRLPLIEPLECEG